MKKVILACAAFAALGFASCQPSKADLKKEFVKACNDAGDKQFTDSKTRQIFHEYCDCSGEKAVNKFTIEEWKEFNKMQKDGREQEMQAKLMPVIQPCLTELQTKMMASMGAGSSTMGNTPTEPAPAGTK